MRSLPFFLAIIGGALAGNFRSEPRRVLFASLAQHCIRFDDSLDVPVSDEAAVIDEKY